MLQIYKNVGKIAYDVEKKLYNFQDTEEKLVGGLSLLAGCRSCHY